MPLMGMNDYVSISQTYDRFNISIYSCSVLHLILDQFRAMHPPCSGKHRIKIVLNIYFNADKGHF